MKKSGNYFRFFSSSPSMGVISVQVVVPEKSMKVDGGKNLTVGIRQTLFI